MTLSISRRPGDALLALAALMSVAVARPVCLAAQEAPPLTADGAVALARVHHPALTIAGARREALVGLARQEAVRANPVVAWRQENVDSPLQPDIFATVSLSLGVGRWRPALRASARAVDTRGRADSLAVARAVDAGAARAFWEASLAGALRELASSRRLDAACLAQAEAARAREGVVAELGALRTALELERARLAAAAAEADWSRARAELARATGVAPAMLPAVPALLPVVAPTAVPTVERALADAFARRPEIAARQAAVAVAAHRRTAARRAVLPDVAVEAGTKRTAGLTTGVVGVAVPLPLFDRNAGARAAADAELRLALAELAAAEQAVVAEVTAAVATLDALVAPGLPRPDSLAARADEVAAIADAAYAAGGGSLLELLEARRARLEARTTALRWTADLHLARLELARATGAPLSDSLETP